MAQACIVRRHGAGPLPNPKGRHPACLHFRDIDGREVDFVVVESGQPIAFIECKLGDESVTPGLRYLKTRFARVIAWQVSAHGQRDYVSAEGVRVAPAARLLRELV